MIKSFVLINNKLLNNMQTLTFVYIFKFKDGKSVYILN